MALESKQFYYQQSISSTTFLYGRMGDAGDFPVQGLQGAVGNGTTTVTAAAGTPFDPVQAHPTNGDIILFFNPTQTDLIRRVTAKASGASITIDSSIPSGTYAWRLYPFRSGSEPAPTSGWHYVNNWFKSTLMIDVLTQAATSLNYRIQTLPPGPGSTPIDMGPAIGVPLTAVGTTKVEIDTRAPWLRVGIAIVGAGTDVVTMSVVGDPRGR